jgi:hypothetical protein
MDLTLSLWKTLEIYFRIVITPVTVDENTKLCKYETKKKLCNAPTSNEAIIEQL